MAALKAKIPIRFLVYLMLPTLLTGCSEFRALVSVLFNGANSLSTSAFEFDELRSGSHASCAILGDKTVRCVGNGANGNLGVYSGGPVEVSGEVKAVATGKEFSCVVVGQTLQVFCFGRNDRGQLGNAAFGNSLKPVPVLDSENSNAPIQDVKVITAGDAHACALLKSGRAVCWGDNSVGQTGNPSATLTAPHSVLENERTQKAMPTVKLISAKGNSTCLAAREDSSVYCFGDRFGATRKVNWVPEKIEITNSFATLSEVKEIGVGRGFGCALAKNSQVYCWGRNELNQLGALSSLSGIPKANLVQVTYPQEMPLNHIDTITVGEYHTCAVHRDEKTVYCWGDNRFGQLGNTSVRGNPEQVALGSNNLTLKGVKAVSVGTDRSCIISLRDEVFCWGNGAHGLLGNDKVISQYPIRALDANGEGLASAVQISVGTDHSCFIDSAQKLYCFGLNTFGQLGFRMFSGSAILADKKPITKVTSMDSSGDQTCLVHGEEQGVACFGAREIDNINKRPEHNSFILEELKRSTQSFKGLMGVAIGKGHICVIESSQGVTCINFADAINSASSYTVLDTNQHPLKDIWQVRSKDGFNCGLTQESGGIWCWGQWKSDNWANARLIPTQGKMSSEFIQFAMSDDQICGIRGVERLLYCTKLSETSAEHFELEPVVADDGKPLKGMLMIAGGDHHFCAANEDGKLYCWGMNDAGQLGFKSKAEYQKPTMVQFKNDELKKVTRISAGDRYSCVAGTDDPALFCFGESLFGGANSAEAIEYPL